MIKQTIKKEIFNDFKQLLKNASSDPDNFKYVGNYNPELLIYHLKLDEIYAETDIEKFTQNAIIKKFTNKINELKENCTPTFEISECLKDYAKKIEDNEVRANMVGFLVDRDIHNIIKENNEKFANEYRKAMNEFMNEYEKFIDTYLLKEEVIEEVIEEEKNL